MHMTTLSNNQATTRRRGMQIFTSGFIETLLAMVADLGIKSAGIVGTVQGAHVGLILAMLVGGLISGYGANKVLLTCPNRGIALATLAGFMALWVALILVFAFAFERIG